MLWKIFHNIRSYYSDRESQDVMQAFFTWIHKWDYHHVLVLWTHFLASHHTATDIVKVFPLPPPPEEQEDHEGDNFYKAVLVDELLKEAPCPWPSIPYTTQVHLMTLFWWSSRHLEGDSRRTQVLQWYSDGNIDVIQNLIDSLSDKFQSEGLKGDFPL